MSNNLNSSPFIDFVPDLRNTRAAISTFSIKHNKPHASDARGFCVFFGNSRHNARRDTYIQLSEAL
ncbi:MULTISPECIES: hypothetical protein [unclassified Pseudomonas]|uniref:hypothetical protein n=1 Tax=unclassified Pseudomonas TaxID=196821 RepID=UPI00081BFBF6|nr:MULTISPECIES: hypothetical protein [unclassified Pseudomonas]MBY8929519.1 hypothetical protein [Pseudomonas sp. Wu6]POM11786.1 hypothetical protein CUU62_06915 [Pseudomonas sp. WP001]